MKTHEYFFGLTRISLGLIFLWAFFDKLLGLGFATKSDAAWIIGGSPTSGFLEFATKGPLAGLFKLLSGVAFVDWLFMIGLLLIGVCLILGIGMRVASYSGALLMFLMYLAVMPPEHHPFLDEHIVYAFVLLGLNYVGAGKFWGLGSWWQKQKFVKKNKWMV
jgi:thiosulfate dehydrogenase [quinone] large subunit